jgi:hypothetical protein
MVDATHTLPIDPLLARLRERWSARGILHTRSASLADINTFEQRYGVVLPLDLRAYFMSVNGTAFGRFGMEDGDLLGFWHLDQVRTFAEELASDRSMQKVPPHATNVFAIADHSIWVYGFGIQLSADPAARTPVVASFGHPYHEVAASFTEFLQGYLRGDPDIINPAA